jgi:tetratricopeptide (TPR) repeat protein
MRRLLLVVLALQSLTGCVAQDDRRIDEHLMAALGQARALHHLADVHMAQGEPDKALEAVRRILEIDFPAGAPERDDVVADACGRIAKIQLGMGALGDAATTVEQALAQSRRDTFYTASLHMIDGEIHETRATQARTGHDEETARTEGRQAIQAYEDSIAINQRVMDRIAREERQEEPR